MIKLRVMSCLGSLVFAGAIRSTYKYFVGISEGKRQLGRIRCKWDDGIKAELKIMGWKGEDCIYVTQDSEQNWAMLYTRMIHRVP
jgi:hypothetical protein